MGAFSGISRTTPFSMPAGKKQVSSIPKMEPSHSSFGTGMLHQGIKKRSRICGGRTSGGGDGLAIKKILSRIEELYS